MPFPRNGVSLTGVGKLKILNVEALQNLTESVTDFFPSVHSLILPLALEILGLPEVGRRQESPAAPFRE